MPQSPSSVWNPDSRPPVRWREVAALLSLVVVADTTLYRGQGLAGCAAFFAAASLLLLIASPRPHLHTGFWIVGLMLAAFSVRLVWYGSLLFLPVGFGLLLALAMSLSGQRPFVLETIQFGTQALVASQGVIEYGRFLAGIHPRFLRANWLNIILPLLTAILFSTLFVLANPDLVATINQQFSQLLETLRDWLVRFAPEPLELVFWLGVLWIGMGLIRPFVAVARSAAMSEDTQTDNPKVEQSKAALYPALRNTLIVVIVLFAIYLVFEFKTLWFRVFPVGFGYSGYAHEGAAWLTVALALATIVLSLGFRGEVLQDPRLPNLKRLAWLWSLQNLVLAAAVYNRLLIYIGYNGMSRMRTVALFGISAVVVGFLLVLWKIARQHDFVWLLRRHLWTLAIAVYLFVLVPVDAFVVRYNVRQILDGDPKPSVQISVHPISSEGVPALQPLLDCEDVTIREGIHAMLALRHEQAERLAERRAQQGWTAYQMADQRVLESLRAAQDRWTAYQDRRLRDETLEKFDEYADQWY